MARIDEELLMAHVDGELDPLAAGRVAEALAQDSDLRAEAEAQRRLRDRLSRHYDPVLDEEVPKRLRAMLDTNVVELRSPGTARRPSLGWRVGGAMAASFLVGLIAAQTMTERAGQAGVTGDRLVAAGPLAETLDTQLASEQPESASTRIGVSFAADDGRLCRTFENAVMAGLACRDGESWHVLTHVAARPAAGGEYRQAASGADLVMRVSQEMMKGEPFDAKAERRARDTRWVFPR